MMDGKLTTRTVALASDFHVGGGTSFVATGLIYNVDTIISCTAISYVTSDYLYANFGTMKFVPATVDQVMANYETIHQITNNDYFQLFNGVYDIPAYKLVDDSPCCFVMNIFALVPVTRSRLQCIFTYTTRE